MREIKFQLVWQGAIYEPITLKELILGQWEIEGRMFEDDDFEGNKKGDTVSTTRKDYLFFSETENDFGVWREYTGLKDKNGKEIYEGDILKTNEHIDYVVWRDDLCGFSYKNDNSRMNLSDWIEHGQYSGTEIIGNIYENPELLK